MDYKYTRSHLSKRVMASGYLHLSDVLVEFNEDWRDPMEMGVSKCRQWLTIGDLT